MKNTILVPALALLMFLSITSCGKAKEKDETVKDSEVSEVTVSYTPAQEESMPEKTEGIDLQNSSIEGKELMCLADSLEQAEEIAAQYSIELVEYRFGVAAFHTDRLPSEVIAEGIKNGWPELSENHVVQMANK